MKKTISIFLALVLMLSLVTPVFAAREIQYQDKIPVIYIAGDGTPIGDANDNTIFEIKTLFSDLTSADKDSALEAFVNVSAPLLVDGMLLGDYTKYYNALYKEISELFPDARLDCDGNATNGTGLKRWFVENMEYSSKIDKKLRQGYYTPRDYNFYYDWRLDPLENAEYFKDFVETIKKTTGSPKVSIIASCLGASVVMSYVEKYGTGSIHGLSINATTVNGAEILSEPISGKFKIDANAINRMLYDLKALGMFDIDDFINKTINLLAKSGAIDSVKDFAKEKIYYVILKGVTSALSLSTFFTWPSYWSGVTSEDLPVALDYVFGEEGSEKRTEYAGLIEKIQNYDVKVRQHLDELLDKIHNDGVKLAIVSKYGFQIAPMVESREEIGDQFVSVKRSSFGATTSLVYNTLSDDYIAQRVSEGKGKYISPDKQIDASTCKFPDYTWFVKGSSHSNFSSDELNLLYTVITADRQLTVEDTQFSRFLVYDYPTNEVYTMTEENCDTYNWSESEETLHPQTKKDKLRAFLESLFEWLASAFRFIIQKFGK